MIPTPLNQLSHPEPWLSPSPPSRSPLRGSIAPPQQLRHRNPSKPSNSPENP